LRKVSLVLCLIRLGMLLSAAGVTGIGCAAARDIGLPIFVQAGFVPRGTTLVDIGGVSSHQWRAYLVHIHYMDGCIDGLCPDRGAASSVPTRGHGMPTGFAVTHQSKPRATRVRTIVALARPEEIDRAFRDSDERNDARNQGR